MDVQTIYLFTYFCTHFILKTSVQKVVHKQYLNILSRKNLIFQSNYLISFEICIFPHFLKKSYNSIPKLFDLTKMKILCHIIFHFHIRNPTEID